MSPSFCNSNVLNSNESAQLHEAWTAKFGIRVQAILQVNVCVCVHSKKRVHKSAYTDHLRTKSVFELKKTSI